MDLRSATEIMENNIMKNQLNESDAEIVNNGFVSNKVVEPAENEKSKASAKAAEVKESVPAVVPQSHDEPSEMSLSKVVCIYNELTSD
jgi:hypothetical protein